jgi:magnesium chelatase subunit D
VVDQEKAKKAILCTLVSPDINGVLLSGDTGCAKTVLARAAGALVPDRKLVNLPLNATGERVVGSLDLESALMAGEKRILPGLLHEADGNILFIDDINLLDETLANTVLKALERRSVLLEREGFSLAYPSCFTLLATMNPLEGELSGHIRDRFDICVDMETLPGKEQRIEILRRNFACEAGLPGFRENADRELEAFRDRLREARLRYPCVILPEGHIELISDIVLELGVSGHRGDIALGRVSRALAALDGRDQVNFEDIREAARLTLDHRKNNHPESASPQPESSSGSPENNNSSSPQDAGDSLHPDTPACSPEAPESGNSPAADRREVFGIGKPFRVIDYLPPGGNPKPGACSGRGKRNRMRGISGSGRYVAFRNPEGKVTDLALDATLRAAAPYQKWRNKGRLAVALEKRDFREKVRLKKQGASILFLVDASGSMAARKRMIAVKGAVLSLLQDAYRKRDTVGMMAFYAGSAELLLPLTGSVDLAYRKLESMPSGGKTPLALGLSRALEVMTGQGLQKAGGTRVIVLISDGRANVPLTGNNALEDALAIAGKCSHLPVKFIVIDTESGYPRFGFAGRLAGALGGSYFRLEDLDSGKLADYVRGAVHAAAPDKINQYPIGGIYS